MMFILQAAQFRNVEDQIHRDGAGPHQLAAHTVSCLEGAHVQEVIIAPVVCLPVLLERVIHI